MGLSVIIAITNSNGDRASPWKIPPWLFTPAKVFPPAVNSTFFLVGGFLDKLYDFVGYFVYRISFWSESTPYLIFFVSFDSSWGYVDQFKEDPPFLWFPCSILRLFFFSLLVKFSHQLLLAVFHWSLSDYKCPHFTRTLLSILADLNNAVVSMVSIFHLISNPPAFFPKFLGTVPSAPNKIGNTVTFIFHSNSLACLSSSILFPLWSCGNRKTSQTTNSFFFLLINTKSALLAGRVNSYYQSEHLKKNKKTKQNKRSSGTIVK